MIETAVRTVNASISPTGQSPYARLPVGASSTLAAIARPDTSVSAISVEISDSAFRPPVAWNVIKQKIAPIKSVGHHSTGRLLDTLAQCAAEDRQQARE